HSNATEGHADGRSGTRRGELHYVLMISPNNERGGDYDCAYTRAGHATRQRTAPLPPPMPPGIWPHANPSRGADRQNAILVPEQPLPSPNENSQGLVRERTRSVREAHNHPRSGTPSRAGPRGDQLPRVERDRNRARPE